jgi:3-oxoacyl-[acyl-carrier protein] reductase
VNTLALGAVETEMLSSAFPGYVAPLTGKEMSKFISYFCLEGNKYFNGKAIPVSSSTP